MSRPDLTPDDLAGLLHCNRECADLREWERAARTTRRDPESRLWAVLCALVLGIGIGGGAVLHIIGRLM